MKQNAGAARLELFRFHHIAIRISAFVPFEYEYPHLLDPVFRLVGCLFDFRALLGEGRLRQTNRQAYRYSAVRITFQHISIRKRLRTGREEQAKYRQCDPLQPTTSSPPPGDRAIPVIISMFVHRSSVCDYQISHWYISFQGVISMRMESPPPSFNSINKLRVRPAGNEIRSPSTSVTEASRRSAERADIRSYRFTITSSACESASSV